MKKRILLFSAIGLLIPFTVGCTKTEPQHQHEYSYSVIEEPNKTIYLSGQNFDPTGITISKSCNGCGTRPRPCSGHQAWGIPFPTASL